MSIVVEAPYRFEGFSDNKIFLAGSIEMGKAEDWQQHVINEFANTPDVVIFNPRRSDWDDSWVQHKDNYKFRQQVEWELDHLMSSDYVLFYFQPGTKSPVTLLELGYVANGDKVIVVCPTGFWRKGNIDILCEKLNIPVYESLDEAIKQLKETLQ